MSTSVLLAEESGPPKSWRFIIQGPWMWTLTFLTDFIYFNVIIFASVIIQKCYLFACSPHLVILSSIILLSILEASSWVRHAQAIIFFWFNTAQTVFWAVETLLYGDVSDKPTNWRIVRKEGWRGSRGRASRWWRMKRAREKSRKQWGKTWYTNVSEGAMNGWKDREWEAGGECQKWSEPEMWRYHHPGNRMAAVLEPRGDFLFVSSIQEVRGP